VIENFKSVSRNERVEVTIDLITPFETANYVMYIGSYNEKLGGWIDYTDLTVSISKTCIIVLLHNKLVGSLKQFRAHSMYPETRLYPSQTGPLEIMLFLRYILPETAGTTYGRIIIDIYPKIPKPSFVSHGEVKCFFFGNVDAASVQYDD